MEKSELENRALRKTIVALANQMEKIEREHKKDPPVEASDKDKEVPGTGHNHVLQQSPKPKKLHNVNWNREKPSNFYVWDPAVRSLVPIRNTLGRKKHVKGRNRNNMTGRRNEDDSSSRVISPFPRRYTSSHIPRYRRKYEMCELKRQLGQTQL